MGKPLLTDEILEKAKRSQYLEELEDGDRFGYYSPKQMLKDEFEPEYTEEYTGYQEGQTIRIPVDSSIVKSRRIETIKREEFRGKVNKILFWVILLLIVFIIAVLFF